MWPATVGRRSRCTREAIGAPPVNPEPDLSDDAVKPASQLRFWNPAYRSFRAFPRNVAIIAPGSPGASSRRRRTERRAQWSSLRCTPVTVPGGGLPPPPLVAFWIAPMSIVWPGFPLVEQSTKFPAMSFHVVSWPLAPVAGLLS